MQGRAVKLPRLKKIIDSHRHPMIQAVLFIFALCLLLLGRQLDRELQTRLRTKQQNLAQSILVPRANALTAAVNRRLSLVDSIVAFIHTHPKEEHLTEEFKLFAGGLYQSGSGIRAIQIFPNGINKFTYPLSNNQSALGHNLLTDRRPRVRRDVQRAIRTGRITLSGPYILRQGGLGLVARKAVYHNGHFWGLAVVILDLPSLLKEADLTDPTDGLQFTLLTDQGQRLLGLPKDRKDCLGSQRVNLPDGYWTIFALANSRWEETYLTDLWGFRLVLAVVLVLLLVIAHLIYTRQLRLASLVGERTQELIAINKRLEEDIAARIQTEQKLVLSEKRYRSLVEQASDGIIVMDQEGRFIDVNTMACEMLGYARGEMLGQTIDDFIPHSDIKENPSRLAQVVLGEIKRFDRRLLRKDGSIIMVESTIKRFENGECLAILRDITEKRRIEQIHNTFFDNSVMGRFIVDREGCILQINGEMMRITGLPSLDFSGKTLIETFPALATTFTYFCQRVIADGVTIRDLELSWEIPGQPGNLHYWLSSFFPIKDLEGRLLCVGSTFNEITRRKQTEEDLKKLNIELERRVSERTSQLLAANKELESFSYSVSHDLRAPLRAMTGFSQALLEDFGERLDEKAKDYLHRVHQGSLRMARLIDDLLKLSRITRTELNLHQTDISLLAQTVIGELQQNDPGRRVEFIIPPGLVAVTDEGLMRIVLENLLGNALKFTKRVNLARIELGNFMEDGESVFFIRDNGAGFDMAYAERLFAPFQRLHKAEEFEGTGIGLATVRRIIYRHGGRIWAVSTVGEGATFYFTLGR